MKTNIDMLKRTCLRCGHTWIKRMEQDPRACPKCHSPYWNIERKKPKEPIMEVKI